jgi:hypothetical protein
LSQSTEICRDAWFGFYSRVYSLALTWGSVICVVATCSVRATLQRSFPSLVYACLVRFIFAAASRKLALVLFLPLQVSSILFYSSNIVLVLPLQSPWSSVTQGSF